MSLLVTLVPILLGVITYDTGLWSQLWLANTHLRADRDIQHMQSLDSSSNLCKLNVGSTYFHISYSLQKGKKVVDEILVYEMHLNGPSAKRCAHSLFSSTHSY